jgi:hypothetical protein
MTMKSERRIGENVEQSRLAHGNLWREGAASNLRSGERRGASYNGKRIT